jgi:ABC-type iron transport system FetAB permease component
VLTQTLHLRFQQITALGLISLPLVFAAQLLVDIDPLIALGYEVLLMLTSLNSGLIALWGLQQMAREVCGGLAKTNTMRRGIPKV